MNIKISPTLLHLDTIDYRTLKDFQGNLKDLSKRNYDKLKKSIEKQFDFPFFVWKDKEGNNWIFDGHQRHRVLLAEKAEPYELPCIFIDAKDVKEAKKKLLALNSQYGTMTKEGFDEFTFDFEPFEFDELIEFTTMESWLDEEADQLEAQEDDFDTTPPEQPKTVLGDLYEIGEHRLLCGDSTDSDQVARLMNGEKADMVFTSPPYNSGGNSGTGGYRGNKNRETKDFYTNQKNTDNWTKEDYFNFCISILNNISLNCNDITPILWNVMYNANSRDDYGKIIFSDLNPFTVKETIIWDKGVGMNICGTGILSRSCELIFLMSKSEIYYTNQKNDTYWNVWRISNKEGENMKWGHGASFPIKLPFEGIEKFSKLGACIYEPFCGSGTTMVSAHQLKRKCYGMELEPKYCDVIVKRMLALDNSLTVKRNGVDVTVEFKD